MVKIVSFLFFFSILLFGDIQPIKSDFKPCFNRTKNSFVKIGKRDFIAVGKHRALIFSKRYIKGAIKRDPFLGLYLIKTKKSLSPVVFTPFYKLENYKTLSATRKSDYKLVSILSLGNPLESFAKINKTSAPNAVLESVCCKKFGITTGKRGFIDSDFIIRFLKHKRVVYGDCGVRFIQKGKRVLVKQINPFFGYFKLRVGDEIVSVDGKRFKNVASLDKYILFSRPSKIVTIRFKRGKRIYRQKIKLKKRVSGGLIGESYFEYIGLYLGRDLRIRYVTKGSLADKLGLKKGDKLLKINDTYVKSYSQVKRALSRLRSSIVYLLFDRDDFQFFVHFRR